MTITLCDDISWPRFIKRTATSWHFRTSWHRWCVGANPEGIKRHEIEVQIPDGFHQRCEGRRMTLMGLKATWHVVGLVVRMSGVGTRFALTDAA
jgi:hypothetical protein